MRRRRNPGDTRKRNGQSSHLILPISKGVLMQVSVFVTSIKKENGSGRVVVEASNGSESGPPFVRFQIQPHQEVFPCVIGKRYYLTIAETLD
jgi:hypothetical protein